MLIRVLGKENEALSGTWSHPFSDVPSWADKYVGYAYQSKLTNGVSATQFGTGTVNAQMYLTFVLRALGYSDSNGLDFTRNNPYTLSESIGILPDCVNTSSFWRADVVLISYAALPATIKGSGQTLAQKLIAAGVFTQKQYDTYYDSSVIANYKGSYDTPTELSAEQIYSQCSPAVFYIEVFDDRMSLFASGSGFFIDSNGTAVTNYHVIEGASDVQVLSQGRYLKTEIVGYDELTDLAVLRVMEDIELPAVQMGDMSDVRVGDWAIVIGNPLGKQFADTVTVGVVSALNRELESSSIVKMLQTDAAINSGNSGGGLFNTRGELIGIPSLKFSSNGKDDIASIEGIAMAIPVDVVQPIVNSIIQYGKVTRPKLGISVMTIRGSEKPTVGLIPAGVYVSAVAPESTAERAGIKAHDIIIGMDGERIALHTDLTNRLAARSAGDVITLTIYRIPGLEKLTVQDEIPAGEELEFQITLEMPSQDA